MEGISSMDSDLKFGFIIIMNCTHGTLFGTLCGSTREVLHKLTVDLPRRHPSGHPRHAALALRLASLRMERIHEHMRKSAELATQFYIDPATSQPNVFGLILAGSRGFMTELCKGAMLDPRLQDIILEVVNVRDGRDDGFDRAIEWSTEILANPKWYHEKRVLGKYFDEIVADTGKYIYGVDDTLWALEMGALKTLLVWEGLETNRYVLKNAVTGELVIKHLSKEQEVDQSNFREAETEAELEVQEKLSLPEWLANEYKQFGCTLEFVTKNTQEGSQFCRGFGGIGGILRYQLDMRTLDEVSDGEDGDRDEDN